MRLTLPPPPESAPPPAFPVLGVIAPLVAAAVLFAVTGSPFTLVFAALSPVILIAGIVDARVSARRRRRRAERAEERAVADLRGEVAALHRADRRTRLDATPTARSIVDGSAPDSLLWRGSGLRDRPFVLGLGPVPSGISIDGVAGSAATRALVGEAAILHDAPVLVPHIADIGLCGASTLTAAVARGFLLQLAFLVHPTEARIRLRPAGDDWSWVDRLPHWAGEPQPVATHDAGTLRIQLGGADIMIAMATAASALPRACDTVLFLAGATEARIVAGDCTVADGCAVRPDLVSRAGAELAARRLAERAERVAAGEGAELPDRVSLDFLVPFGRAEARPPEQVLSAVLGVTASGPLTIDLARDGPHAVLGGTTGSGKSELLVTWVTSLAIGADPSAVTFLLVDFKGGASFDALARLPHCVGLLTDLDPGAARRALESLRAELRYRERWLRERGIRSLVDANMRAGGDPGAGGDRGSGGAPGAGAGLARLVIVVDEFAAMLADFPELHDVFVDIASRGRSLGVHLVLCSQRPAGAARDSLLANCDLRLSLRVNSRADSIAVVSTDAAATLPPQAKGRCLVSIGGAPAVLAQIAMVPPPKLTALVEQVSERPAGAPPRRPWLDPLPAVLTLAELEHPTVHRGDLTGGIIFGLLDEPAEQRRSYAVWHPRDDGHLLVLGAHRSGKTGLVDTLVAVGAGAGREAPSIVVIPPDPIEAWDVVSHAFEGIRAGHGGRGSRILALDDVDAALTRFDTDYAPVFLDMLSALAREGPASEIHLVLTAQRLSAGLSGIAPLLGRGLLLRMSNRQEHALAGGDVSTFDDGLPPGAGWWRGHRVQVAPVGAARRGNAPAGVAAYPPASGGRHAVSGGGLRVGGAPVGLAPAVILRGGHAYAVVSTRAAAVPRLLEAAARRASGRGATLDVSFLSDPVRTRSATGQPPTSPTPQDSLRVAAPAIDVLVGDPDDWQAAWGAMAAASRSRHIVFDACTVRDYRALTRSKELPPPLRPNGRSVWYLPAGERPGRPERREWPA